MFVNPNSEMAYGALRSDIIGSVTASRKTDTTDPSFSPKPREFDPRWSNPTPRTNMITFPAWVTGPTPCKTITGSSLFPSKHGTIKCHVITNAKDPADFYMHRKGQR